MPAPSSRTGGGIATRLFAVQALIIIVGALTLVLVAAALAPGLFHDHLQRAMGPLSGDVAAHLDEALARALLLSLSIAVVAALLASLAISWFIAARLSRPVAVMAEAATRIADGAYDTRIPPSRLGVEFALLDQAFNRMATSLQHTERRRRELLADLAHELRTPIATIDSFVEGIEDGVVPAAAETWATMRQQTGRLRRLLDDVDSVSRAEERHLNVRAGLVDVDDVAGEAVQGVAAGYAAAAVRLAHRRAATPLRVPADADRLREIFDNLLSNALRHTPPGGTVTVATRAHGTGVEVEVADSGEGIAAEHLPHLFDRFYRVEPARDRTSGGSGIGLTIARALARAHGGDLRAASEGQGRGASFTLTLPR